VKAKDFQLGMRVRRRAHDGAFVKDRTDGPNAPRRNAIVIGLPEQYNSKQKAVHVQTEGTSRSEYILIHRLEALPLEQQPIALGGQWVADDSTFVAPRPKEDPV
jgi:hypothetical protein